MVMIMLIMKVMMVIIKIMMAILIIITWTGCWSDLTASAAEIEPTLDRWTGRPGSGPAHFNDEEEDDDGNSEDCESFGDGGGDGDGGDNMVLVLKMLMEDLDALKIYIVREGSVRNVKE